MKIIILVGGKSQRLITNKNQKDLKPKSLLIINNKALLYHALSTYLKYDYNEFILPLGYYKDDFVNFFKSRKKFYGYNFKVYFDAKSFSLDKVQKNKIKFLLLNTGKNTNKAERILEVLKKLNLSEVGVSYGDGVGNINLKKLYNLHIQGKQQITCAGYKPYSQYGQFKENKNFKIINFNEKPKIEEWVNIGYYFFKKKALDKIKKISKLDLESGIVKYFSKNRKLSV